MLAAIKPRLKALAAKTVWAYDPEDVVKKLRQCGVLPGYDAHRPFIMAAIQRI